jgi:hypothetical protein
MLPDLYHFWTNGYSGRTNGMCGGRTGKNFIFEGSDFRVTGIPIGGAKGRFPYGILDGKNLNIWAFTPKSKRSLPSVFRLVHLRVANCAAGCRVSYTSMSVS